MPDMSTLRRYAAPGALVAGGVLAGAMLAGSLSARAADSQTATPSSSASPNSSTPSAEPPADRPSSGETPLTGTTADKVRAAVLAGHPGATIDRLETDSDGAYEAHITTKAGVRVTVEVSKTFAVTGEEQRRTGRFGGRGDHMAPTALTGTTATKVKAAVLAKHPGATVRVMFADPRGGYAAFITTKDAKQMVVSVSTAFAVTESRDITGGMGGRGGHGFGPGGMGGPGGMHGGFGTELSGTTADKVEAALIAKYPGATVFKMVSDPDGTYRAVVETKDGKQLIVTLDKSFKVTGSAERPARKGHMGGQDTPSPSPSVTPSNSALIS